MRYTLLVITLSLSSAFSIVFAQGIVKGKITDNNTLEPLAGVYVIYRNNQGTTSDENGIFYLKSDSSELNIRFRFVGYKSLARSVSIMPE